MPRTLSPTRITTLCDADAAALDALLDSKGGVPSDPARQAKLRQLLAVLDGYQAPSPSADLTQRTLDAIAAVEQRRRFALQVQSLTAPASAFRWRELLAVAAVMMISLSLLWPMLAQSREQARLIACQSRQGAAGQALASYAVANAGMMPRLAAQPNAAWTLVGQPTRATAIPAQSNPANLYRLATSGHIDPNTLACPDNPNAPRHMTADMHDWLNAAQTSYSYQNQFTRQPISLDRMSGMPVLADKTPIFVPSRDDPRMVVQKRDVPTNSPAIFHQQRGQNVLTGAGNVQWTTDPVINSDNIWLIAGQQAYSGTETPLPNDSFLSP
ncbi:MAG: hypothetical protein WD042_14075 [Phycisphaeraceae bacterium]